MFSTPFLFKAGGQVTTLERVRFEAGFTEDWLQNRLYECPSALPFGEIDAGYRRVCALCREMNTAAGPIDIVYITPEGRLVIVETKLWRNPEARRKVVGQILDYAKELTAWSYSDLQREVTKRTGIKGNSPFSLVSKVFPEAEEAAFVDSVSASLARGDFMLVIAGDGIHQGAKGIVDFLQSTAHMRFILAMVEVGVYKLPQAEDYFIQPRILARTQIIERVVSFAETSINSPQSVVAQPEPEPEKAPWQQGYQRFWKDFLSELTLDDPEQPLPAAVAVGNIAFPLPPSGGTAWITVYFEKAARSCGCFVRLRNSEQGNVLFEELQTMREEIDDELPFVVSWSDERKVKRSIVIGDQWPGFDQPEVTEFLAETVNALVNAFRPRLRHLSELVSDAG